MSRDALDAIVRGIVTTDGQAGRPTASPHVHLPPSLGQLACTNPVLYYVPGTTRKICQLTGDVDAQTGQPTVSRSAYHANVRATDLGISTRAGSRVYFFFGDTSACDANLNNDNDDCIAWSDAFQDPEAQTYLGTGPLLRWMIAPNGLSFQPIRILPPIDYPSYDVSGIDYAGFATPTGPFALDPDDENSPIYVFYTQPSSTNPLEYGNPDILARSDDGCQTFHLVYHFPFSNFVNISSVVVDAETIPGLPVSSGKGVLVFGTGIPRKSNVYLAFCPLDRLEEVTTNDFGHVALPADQWRFFAGYEERTGAAIWGSVSDSAQPLFFQADPSDKNGGPGIGEFSVAFEPSTGLWIMLYAFNYNSPYWPPALASTGAVEARYARSPWGPWDALGLPEILFDPLDTSSPNYPVFGAGGFIHADGQQDGLNVIDSCPTPCAAAFCSDAPASIYAPYLIPSWFKSTATELTIYYTLSTWRPYQAILMKSVLSIACFG